jgi:NitT/TauT family transport system substrate-binding protein
MNQSSRRTFCALGIGVLASFCLTAPSARAAETLTLIGTGPISANDWPILISLKKGYFTEAGITLDWVPASSTAAAIQQVAAGAGQMASGGLTDPMRAIDGGAKISILRIHAQVPPYTLWAKPALKSFADLRGKLIIVGGAKDITRIYLDRMVRPNNLQKGDYDLIYAGTTPARYAALQSGAVDAAILLPPVSFRAEQLGFSLIGRLSDYVKDMPFTGFAVNTTWAKANRTTVTGFLKAYQRGVDWFYADEHKDEAIKLLADETKLTLADAASTYDFLRSIQLFAQKGIVTPDSLATLVKAMADDGDLQGSADPARFIDKDIVQISIDALK